MRQAEGGIGAHSTAGHTARSTQRQKQRKITWCPSFQHPKQHTHQHNQLGQTVLTATDSQSTNMLIHSHIQRATHKQNKQTSHLVGSHLPTTVISDPLPLNSDMLVSTEGAAVPSKQRQVILRAGRPPARRRPRRAELTCGEEQEKHSRGAGGDTEQQEAERKCMHSVI